MHWSGRTILWVPTQKTMRSLNLKALSTLSWTRLLRKPRTTASGWTTRTDSVQYQRQCRPCPLHIRAHQLFGNRNLLTFPLFYVIWYSVAGICCISLHCSRAVMFSSNTHIFSAFICQNSRPFDALYKPICLLTVWQVDPWAPFLQCIVILAYKNGRISHVLLATSWTWCLFLWQCVLLCLPICEKTSTNKQKNVHILTHLSDSYVSALLVL